MTVYFPQLCPSFRQGKNSHICFEISATQKSFCCYELSEKQASILIYSIPFHTKKTKRFNVQFWMTEFVSNFFFLWFLHRVRQYQLTIAWHFLHTETKRPKIKNVLCEIEFGRRVFFHVNSWPNVTKQKIYDFVNSVNWTWSIIFIRNNKSGKRENENRKISAQALKGQLFDDYINAGGKKIDVLIRRQKAHFTRSSWTWIWWWNYVVTQWNLLS